MANVIVSGSIINGSCGSSTLSRMHCLWEVTRLGNIVVTLNNFQGIFDVYKVCHPIMMSRFHKDHRI